MNAIDLLMKDHQGAKKAMDELGQASGAKRMEIFKTLKHELEVHDHIEETIFYPGVLAEAGGAGLNKGDKEAHEAVEETLDQLLELPVEDPDWMPTFNAMRTNLLAHVADEEGNLFPRIRKALSAQRLETLGQRMAEEKEARLKGPKPTESEAIVAAERDKKSPGTPLVPPVPLPVDEAGSDDPPLGR